jgi:phage repressor protein C with HTH and peptisase S24 domain
MNDKSSFASRLIEIVADFPSRAALAKKAGLTPSALQSYVEGAEPTRPALLALARAANVSLEWFADGRGYKQPHPSVPDGYAAIPFFDVGKAGGYVYPLFSAENAEFCYLKLDWLRDPDLKPSKLFMVEATTSVVPEIHDGELLVIDESWKTTFVGSVPKFPAGIYLVSRQAKLTLREVSSVADDSVELVAAGTKHRKELVRVGQEGFTIHGRVIWHARALPVRRSLPSDHSLRRRSND